MDARKQAQQLAGMGRYGDTMLMHVNPKEVQGIASVLPITTNPQTGQPEMFIGALLGSILGSTFLPGLAGGTALGAAGAGAIGSALGTWAETGDLEKGIMSGIMGYGLGTAFGEIGSGSEVLGEIASEESLKAAIAEILKVDLENVPRGMAGTTHPTTIEQVDAINIAAAAEEDTVKKEENEAFNNAVKKIANLEEQVKSLKSDKNRLAKDHNELKSIARQVSGKLTELNTANAKLVYQNRILESSSLNERQKTKLVEAVSNANSTEEAKVIFETLQDSLSSKAQNAPSTLSEAVNKNSWLILKSNKKDSQVSDSASERMKKLAGII